MSTYKEFANSLKNLKEQNRVLKETIEKYNSGEMELILNEIIDVVRENDLLEREISILYNQTYERVIKSPNKN